MTNMPDTVRDSIATIVDDVIARGDLSKLSSEQRVNHYNAVCRSLDLNPLTQPFMYITLNGKLTLYARKDATDQLRKINGINIEITGHTVNEAGMLTVHVRATDKHGRKDEDFGVVSVIGLKGEAAANAFMKAVTKAKRRVTLSISGLGFPDESEIDDEPPHAFPQHQEQPAITHPDAPPIAEPDEPQHAEPHPLVIDAGEGGWLKFAKTLVGYVRGADTLEQLELWVTLNKPALDKMSELEIKMHRMLLNAIDHSRKAFQEAAPDAADSDDR